MKAHILLTCILCGKAFAPGNDKDGIPNGLGFMMKNGETYHLCKSCISSRYEEAEKLIKERSEENETG